MQIQMSGAGTQPPVDNSLNITKPVLLGLIIVGAFFGTFGVWAVLAPLESAAIAPGVVNVSSKRKTLQHLEGGIISEILVREGDQVVAGDVLITLDATRPHAELEINKNRLMSEHARESRLIAERDDRVAITWNAELEQYRGSEFSRKIEVSQTSEFIARKNLIVGQIAILKQRIEQFKAEELGIRSQISSQDEQASLLDDELKSMQRLFEKGLTGKTRLRELQRSLVEVKGSRSQNMAAISRIDQSVSEALLQIADLKTGRLNEVLETLRETQAVIQELTERIAALSDVMNRTSIVAPLSGMVVGLKVFTRGGVISPGEPLLDIVPIEDGLVIEARVDPVDIDVVRPGLDAQVRFVSFNQRSTVPSDATVLTVSADHLLDERTGVSYYLARVILTEAALESLEQAVIPGMPAEVMILTGEKTPLEYFLQPITRSFDRAFRES